MDQALYQNHLGILREELLVALGCTEPIAIAYAGAKARQLLGVMPEHCRVRCSGNIIKNVKGVIVPNSGGMRGIDVAATLGIVGGDPDRELAVLETVTPADIQTTQALVKEGFCTCELVEDVDNLYIVVELEGGGHSAEIEIQEHHNNITYMKKDGTVLLDSRPDPSCKKQSGGPDRMLLNVANILEFADTVKIEDVEELIGRQIDYNTAISDEGLKGNYGVETGRILMENAGNASGLNRVRDLAPGAAEPAPSPVRPCPPAAGPGWQAAGKEGPGPGAGAAPESVYCPTDRGNAGPCRRAAGPGGGGCAGGTAPSIPLGQTPPKGPHAVHRRENITA